MPRLTVRTAAGKRALAEVLAEHDPDYLDDLKMLASVFGPFEEVGYESLDEDTQLAVARATAEARKRYLASK